MKGLKIIPVFVILMVLSYFGVAFVEANREPVILTFGDSSTPPTPLGFVVLTSILAGMTISGLLCSIEIAALFFMNLRLKRKLESMQQTVRPGAARATDLMDLPNAGTPSA